jgi:hypothetical protein
MEEVLTHYLRVASLALSNVIYSLYVQSTLIRSGDQSMGRTIPSFRIAAETERLGWPSARCDHKAAKDFALDNQCASPGECGKLSRNLSRWATTNDN